MKIAPKMPAPVSPEADKQMKEVAKGFENIFVNQMVGAMRKTVVKGGLIPESNAERVYQNMLDQEYAQKITDSNTLGLAEIVYQQLLRGNGSR